MTLAKCFNRRHAGRSILTVGIHYRARFHRTLCFNRRHAGRSILTRNTMSYYYSNEKYCFNRRHAGRSILTSDWLQCYRPEHDEKFQSTARWQINSYPRTGMIYVDSDGAMFQSTARWQINSYKPMHLLALKSRFHFVSIDGTLADQFLPHGWL